MLEMRVGAVIGLRHMMNYLTNILVRCIGVKTILIDLYT
jgi:hypothetical protein